MAADIAPRTVFRTVLNSETGEWEEEIYFEHLEEFSSKAFTPIRSGDQLSSPLMIYVRQLIKILPEEEEPDAHIKELFDAIELNFAGKKVPLDQLKAIIAARKKAASEYGNSNGNFTNSSAASSTHSSVTPENLEKVYYVWISVELKVLGIAKDFGVENEINYESFLIYGEYQKDFASTAFTPIKSDDQLSFPIMIYVRQLIKTLPEEEEPDDRLKELFDAIKLNFAGKKVPWDQLNTIITAREEAVKEYGDSLRMAVAFGYSNESVSPEKVESLKKICDIWIVVDFEVLNIAKDNGVDGGSYDTAVKLIDDNITSLTEKNINADRMKGYLDKMYHVNEALRVGYIFKNAKGVVKNRDMKITGTEAAANFYSELLELYTSTDVPSASSTYENDSKKRKHSGLGKMIADIGALSIDDPRSMKLFEHAIKTNNAELVTQLASQFTNQQF